MKNSVIAKTWDARDTVTNRHHFPYVPLNTGDQALADFNV